MLHNMQCPAPTTFRPDGGRRNWHTSVNDEVISAAQSRNFWFLVQTIEKYLPRMNLVNITTALHRLAKVVEGDDREQATLLKLPLMPALVAAAHAALVIIHQNGTPPSSQSLSNIMWSAAVLHLQDIALFRVIAALAVTHILVFKPLELSTLIWAFARIGSSRGGLRNCGELVFDAAVHYLPGRLHLFTFRNLVTTVGAFATAGNYTPVVFQSIAVHMVRLVHTAKEQELAKTAWAYGTASAHHKKLFAAVAKQSIAHINSFEPKDLSVLLWGFAANDVYFEELFTKASNRIRRLALDAQQLANILWSLTRLRPKDPITCTTVCALLPRCCQQLETFKPQEIASAAMAAAKTFGHVGDELGRLDAPLPTEAVDFFNLVAPMVLSNLSHFSDQSLANLATAYAATNTGGGMNLVAKLGLEVLDRVDRLEVTVLLQLLRVYAVDARTVKASSSHEDICKVIACALFRAAAPRVARFKLDEQRSLSRLLKRIFRIPFEGDLAVQEIARYCTILANGDAAEIEEARDLAQSRTQVRVSLADALFADGASSYFTAPAATVAGSGYMPWPQKVPQDHDLNDTGETCDSSSGHAEEGESNVQPWDTTPSDDTFALPTMLRVKNTFLDTARRGPVDDNPILARPALDFLPRTSLTDSRGLDLELIQAARENYYSLRAVPAIDCFIPRMPAHSTKTGDTSTDSNACGTTPSPSNADERTMTSTAQKQKKSTNRKSSIPIALNDLVAFRKDYQELRAVPALDCPKAWHQDRSSKTPLVCWPPSAYPRTKVEAEKEARGDTFVSKGMKENRKESNLPLLGPPSDFALRTVDLETLNQVRTAYQYLRAVPALDFVSPPPGLSAPSKHPLFQNDDGLLGAEAELDKLGNPLDLFLSLLRDRDMVSRKTSQIEIGEDDHEYSDAMTAVQHRNSVSSCDASPRRIRPSQWLADDQGHVRADTVCADAHVPCSIGDFSDRPCSFAPRNIQSHWKSCEKNLQTYWKNCDGYRTPPGSLRKSRSAGDLGSPPCSPDPRAHNQNDFNCQDPSGMQEIDALVGNIPELTRDQAWHDEGRGLNGFAELGIMEQSSEVTRLEAAWGPPLHFVSRHNLASLELQKIQTVRKIYQRDLRAALPAVDFRFP